MWTLAGKKQYQIYSHLTNPVHYKTQHTDACTTITRYKQSPYCECDKGSVRSLTSGYSKISMLFLNVDKEVDVPKLACKNGKQLFHFQSKVTLTVFGHGHQTGHLPVK